MSSGIKAGDALLRVGKYTERFYNYVASSEKALWYY